MAIDHVLHGPYRGSTPTPSLTSPVASQPVVGINESNTEFSEKDFHDPTAFPPPNSSLSLALPLPSRSPEIHPLRSGMNRTTSQQHLQASFAHVQDSPVVAVHQGHSVSRGPVASPIFPGSPSSQSFSPSSPYVHRNGFAGQFALSPQHLAPFSNAPPQPYPYPQAHGYTTHPDAPVDLGRPQHNPQGYVSLIQPHLQPFFPSQPHSPDTVRPPFQSTLRPPPSAPQAAPGSASSPHPGSHNGQPYQLLHYSSPPSPYSYQQHYQPSPYQWFYVPVNYPQPPPHPQPPDTWTRGPPSAERHGPLSTAQPSPSINESHSGRKPVPPPSVQPQVPVPALSSPVPSKREEKNTVEPSTPARPHNERPLVRRPYHPNPPLNRSEWVMWVGNVPADTNHDEFWRFLTRPESTEPGKDGDVADSGVTSIFLISRSNCAFVNFETEEHLSRAIARFNGRQLRPQDRRCPKLVCRARRKEDDLRAGVGGQRGVGVHTQYIKKLQQQEREKAQKEPSSPEGRHANTSGFSRPPPTPLVRSVSSDDGAAGIHSSVGARHDSKMVKTHSVSSYASTTSSFLVRHFPKRYFILKSLTQFDLDVSVERGLWATQKHNETILDQAYRTSKEVILVFGVNKSGEFYGYARMTGRILHGEHRVSWASRADSSPSSLSSLSSRKQSRGSPGEPKSPLVSTSSRGSPLTYFTPSERRLVEESPRPFFPPQDIMASPSPGQPQTMERQSAPAAFGPPPSKEFSAEAAPKFSLSSGRLRPAQSLIAKASVHIAPKDIVLDKNAPTRAMRNHSGSSEEPKPGMSLQPVEEEKNTGSGGDDDDGAQKAVEEGISPGLVEGRDAGWGESFKIEWICTERLPFHRIRHLRNPWNHDREIKVSRDGTELEPGVGQQLIDEWSSLAAEGEGASRATKPSSSGLPVSEEARVREKAPS
ncbi:YT521-B-like domain-containing protein [Phlebopus sp. FC_14]|nr:YT521-B-like domain-containing protein [Phlebopus sp. FC_14]